MDIPFINRERTNDHGWDRITSGLFASSLISHNRCPVTPYRISIVIHRRPRVTMLGISRWTGRGGSYRTVQRFVSLRFLSDMTFFRTMARFLPPSSNSAFPVIGAAFFGDFRSKSYMNTLPESTAWLKRMHAFYEGCIGMYIRFCREERIYKSIVQGHFFVALEANFTLPLALARTNPLFPKSFMFHRLVVRSPHKLTLLYDSTFDNPKSKSPLVKPQR